MNLSSRLQKATCVVVFVAPLLFARPSIGQDQRTGTSTSSLEGLRISIRLDQAQRAASSHPKFQVELRNAGENNLLLNLGTLALDGREQYPTAISLILTTPAGRQRLSFAKTSNDTEAEPQPLLLPLPSGASFSIPVDLDSYHAVGSSDRSYQLKPGNYIIVAQFTGSTTTRAAEKFPLAPLRNPRQ